MMIWRREFVIVLFAFVVVVEQQWKCSFVEAGLGILQDRQKDEIKEESNRQQDIEDVSLRLTSSSPDTDHGNEGLQLPAFLTDEAGTEAPVPLENPHFEAETEFEMCLRFFAEDMCRKNFLTPAHMFGIASVNKRLRSQLARSSIANIQQHCELEEDKDGLLDWTPERPKRPDTTSLFIVKGKQWSPACKNALLRYYNPSSSRNSFNGEKKKLVVSSVDNLKNSAQLPVSGFLLDLRELSHEESMNAIEELFLALRQHPTSKQFLKEVANNAPPFTEGLPHFTKLIVMGSWTRDKSSVQETPSFQAHQVQLLQKIIDIVNSRDCGASEQDKGPCISELVFRDFAVSDEGIVRLSTRLLQAPSTAAESSQQGEQGSRKCQLTSLAIIGLIAFSELETAQALQRGLESCESLTELQLVGVRALELDYVQGAELQNFAQAAMLHISEGIGNSLSIKRVHVQFRFTLVSDRLNVQRGGDGSPNSLAYSFFNNLEGRSREKRLEVFHMPFCWFCKESWAEALGKWLEESNSALHLQSLNVRNWDELSPMQSNRWRQRIHQYFINRSLLALVRGVNALVTRQQQAIDAQLAEWARDGQHRQQFGAEPLQHGGKAFFLRSLDLSNYRFTDTIVQELANIVRRSNLQTLQLSCERPTYASSEAVAGLLDACAESNSHISYLAVDGLGMWKPQTVSALQQLIQSSRAVKLGGSRVDVGVDFYERSARPPQAARAFQNDLGLYFGHLAFGYFSPRLRRRLMMTNIEGNVQDSSLSLENVQRTLNFKHSDEKLVEEMLTILFASDSPLKSVELERLNSCKMLEHVSNELKKNGPSSLRALSITATSFGSFVQCNLSKMKSVLQAFVSAIEKLSTPGLGALREVRFALSDFVAKALVTFDDENGDRKQQEQNLSVFLNALIAQLNTRVIFQDG